MSITQQMAHWLIALGLDPALSALLALMGLIVLPLLVAIGVVAVVERRARCDSQPVFTGAR